MSEARGDLTQLSWADEVPEAVLEPRHDALRRTDEILSPLAVRREEEPNGAWDPLQPVSSDW